MSWQQLGLLFGFLLKGIYGPSCCLVAKLCSTILANCLDCSLPGSSVTGISQQECLRGLPFPPPGDLSSPGIEPASPALQADPLPLIHQGSMLHKATSTPISQITLVFAGNAGEGTYFYHEEELD